MLRLKEAGLSHPAFAALPALCLASAVMAGIVMSREWTVQAIASGMANPMDEGQGVLADHADDPPAALGDRANAGLAEIAVIAAFQASAGGERQLALSRAKASLAQLAKHRPDWATTHLLTAQLDVAEHGAPSPQGLAAYGDSYRMAPFLMQEARWRIAYGAAYWARLPAATREAMLDEAEWFTRFDGGRRKSIEALFGDSPAGLAYQFRMVSGRVAGGSADDN